MGCLALNASYEPLTIVPARRAVRLVLDGGGVRAIDNDGNDLGGHQAFWFAWSQFYPGTRLWPVAGSG